MMGGGPDNDPLSGRDQTDAGRRHDGRTAQAAPVGRHPGRIVPAEPRHYPEWLALWRGYLDFYGVSLRDEVTAATWARVSHSGGDHCCLIHEDAAGRATGFVIYLFHRASWTDGWNCCIEDIYVAPASRGSGLGRILMEAALAAARDRRAYRVYWQTDRDNAAARRLYDELGQLADVVQYRVEGP
jgi:GNAT superfamily N-acetyltransferase